jgi:tetratricopeptide (TPR) repeat protein/GT2 family glycosyltransferase
MRPRVSLTMIVKNEEANLPACLGSVADLVDEIVVVDTGSTDATREVAARLGARVHRFAWVDDFAAARNESLRHATGQWVFWLDGDEWLDETNRDRLRRLLAGLADENAAYVMQQLCTRQAPLPGAPGGADQVVEQVRLFRNHPQVRWRHRVYEQILPSVRELGGVRRPTDVVIQHPGYQDPAVHLAKAERNLRLARREHEEHPEDPYVLYTLGLLLALLGRDAESLPYLSRGRERLPAAASYGAKLHALLVQAHHRLGRRQEALVACRSARALFPADGELLHQEATLLEETGDRAGAEARLLELARPAPGSAFAGAGPELRSHARHVLACAYRDQGREAEAEALWHSAVAECPAFAPGWLGLAELALARGRWGEVEPIARRLEEDCGRPRDAAALREKRGAAATAAEQLDRARRLHQAGDPAGAEPLYWQVVRADPANAEALYLLGAACASLGKLSEAAAALGQAARLQPGRPEVHNQLGVALARQGKLAEAAACFRETLRLQPGHAEAQRNLRAALERLGGAAGTQPLRHDPGPDPFRACLDEARSLREQGRLDDAVSLGLRALALRPDAAEAHNQLGVTLARQGKPAEAAACFREALRRQPGHAAAHNNLGNALSAQGLAAEALACYRQAVLLQPDLASAQNNLGQALLAQGHLEEAAAAFRQALRVRPDWADCHNNLGAVLAQRGDLGGAAASFREAVRLRPDAADSRRNLGQALSRLGRWEEAAACWAQVAALQPDDPLAPVNEGLALLELGRLADAEASFRRALLLRPDAAAAHCGLGLLFRKQKRRDEAAASLREALRLQPDLVEAHTALAEVLWDGDDYDGAVARYEQALRLQPSNRLRLLHATLLPPVYRSAAELQAWRRRLTDHVRRLHEDRVTLDLTREHALTLFPLAYHGLNDRDILESVARLYVAPRPGPDAAAVEGSGQEQIQVGFLSRYFRRHTIGELMGGLIARLARPEFGVTVLSVGHYEDETARFIRGHADRCVELPDDLQAARRLIADLRLDVLVYTDVGLDPVTQTLALSRLAPVQCVTWGHPSTTGIPTIDYFLSSALFEGPGAGGHYTETLVRLKNLPFYCERPAPPAVRKDRAALGLPEGCHLYAVPQTLFKCQPGFDEILGEVLRADPRGLVVLNEVPGRNWHEVLRRRFEAVIPDVAGRVRFLPRLSHDDYLNLNLLADVLLDPVHFNGGHTSLKGLALGTPIVTLDGELLKTRMTGAMYRAMGVLDCVTATPREYAATAVRLACDRDYRDAVRARILATNEVLFENPAPIRDLEQFFREAVGRRRASRSGAALGPTGRRASRGDRTRRPRVSLCMIVRNEEGNLPDCLRTAADLVDEVIVVDTGSTDGTREVAARLGARVFDFPWVDDFAAARNEGLRHATGDWIFWLDADDRLNEDNRRRLRTLFAGLGATNAAFLMKCLCPGPGGTTVVEHARLFRNHPDVRWRFRIHEQILPSVQRLGGSVHDTDVVIHHTGYQDPALHRRKLERNLRLLQLAQTEHPDEPWVLVELGQNYLALGRTHEALPLLRRGLERSHPGDPLMRRLCGQLARCYHQLGQRNEALAACRAGLARYPDFAELLFLECQLLQKLGDLAGAEAGLLRLQQPGAGFRPGDVGLCGYKARHELGVVYRKHGRDAEAEAQWQAVLAERPDYAPAWLALGDLWLAQGRLADVERAAGRLRTEAYGAAIAAALQARVQQSRAGRK